MPRVGAAIFGVLGALLLVRRNFDQAVAVRKAGGASRDLADRYFFETLVRVHRAGEGAPYTGIKPPGTKVELEVVRSLPLSDSSELPLRLRGTAALAGRITAWEPARA